MKSKALRIVLLVFAIVICLSVGLYAAHSFNQAKAQAAVMKAAPSDSQYGFHEAKLGDMKKLRKAD